MPEAAAGTGERAALGSIKVFGDGFGFFFRRFGSLLAIASPAALAIGLCVMVLVPLGLGEASVAGAVLLGGLSVGAFGGWCAGAYVQALADLEREGRVRVIAAIRAAGRRAPALIGAGVLFAVGAVLVVGVVGMLIALLVQAAAPLSFPGLLAAPALLGMLFARAGGVFWALREGSGLATALRQARAMSRGRVLGGAVPFALTLIVILVSSPVLTGVLFAVIDPLLTPAFRSIEVYLVIAILAAPTALAVMLLAAVTAVYGRRLLVLRDGETPEDLAEIFE